MLKKEIEYLHKVIDDDITDIYKRFAYNSSRFRNHTEVGILFKTKRE